MEQGLINHIISVVCYHRDLKYRQDGSLHILPYITILQGAICLQLHTQLKIKKKYINDDLPRNILSHGGRQWSLEEFQEMMPQHSTA